MRFPVLAGVSSLLVLCACAGVKSENPKSLKPETEADLTKLGYVLCDAPADDCKLLTLPYTTHVFDEGGLDAVDEDMCLRSRFTLTDEELDKWFDDGRASACAMVWHGWPVLRSYMKTNNSPEAYRVSFDGSLGPSVTLQIVRLVDGTGALTVLVPTVGEHSPGDSDFRQETVPLSKREIRQFLDLIDTSMFWQPQHSFPLVRSEPSTTKILNFSIDLASYSIEGARGSSHRVILFSAGTTERWLVYLVRNLFNRANSQFGWLHLDIAAYDIGIPLSIISDKPSVDP